MIAPETMLDNKGRRILWAWVLDRKSGVSSGTMSMPRILTLSKDKLSLNIEPPKEIKDLRYCHKEEKPFSVDTGQPHTLENVAGNSLELSITIDPGKAKRFGIKVFCSADGREETPVIVDMEKNLLSIDMRKSSLDKPVYREFVMIREPNPSMDTQDAPFMVGKGEKVSLRIFLDKPMLEVFANDRKCITQVIYPTLKDAIHIQVFAEDAPIRVEELKSWNLFPAMQW
jgi:beta-fructofuranosidase